MKDTNNKYDTLKSLVLQFPLSPGVYLMKNFSGKVIYVGKARHLKNRVSSYFSGTKDIKTRFLVQNISTIEYVETKTEYEALLLENNYIKKYTPRYNINLKDGKTYPVIRMTAEEYPRIFRTRNVVKDGSKYWGPFPDVKTLEIYMKLIEILYPLRKCRSFKLKKREKPCLYYHINRCSGACAGMISLEDYRARVKKVEGFLSGDIKPVLQDLKERMKKASGLLQFERAAELRDMIESVKKISSEQIIEDFDPESRDYLSSARLDSSISFSVFQMRNGKITGRNIYRADFYDDIEEAYIQFFIKYYQEMKNPPRTVYIDADLDTDLLQKFLRKIVGNNIYVLFPQIGKHQRLTALSKKSAELDLQNILNEMEMLPALESLQKKLGLPRLPMRIEGFDIAHLDGTDTVSSLISFYKGKPDRKNYRKFKIKSLDGKIDDFQSISEAVARRYTRVLNENLERPDLILVDGGKGQVSSAYSVLKALGMDTIPLVGLAKRNEEIYPAGITEPICLKEGDPALRILQNVRDETHRFATGFNQQLRKKRIKLGVLEAVPGIGKKRSEDLLKTFGSVEKIAESEPAYIANKGHIPLHIAESLKQYLIIKNPKKVD